MAGQITKFVCCNSGKIWTKPHFVHLKFSGPMTIQTQMKHKSCENDCYTNKCGMRKLTQPPCKPCGDPLNKCEPCSPDIVNACPPWKYEPRKTRYAYKQDTHAESCESGQQANAACTKDNRVGFIYHRPRSPWEMLYYDPHCCPVCLPELPRFDEIHYKMRKMCEREYYPTWAECPRPRIVQKIVCCYDREPIEVPRRIRCKPPQTACPLPEDALNRKLTVCKVGGDPNCVKVFTPCCCPARNPPKCIRIRKPICTGRLLAPSPAFSECIHPPPNPTKPRECKCLIVDPLCGYPPVPPRALRTC